MSGSNLHGFDWENFGAVDRWSFMGGGPYKRRLTVVTIIMLIS